jgi:hypothetical protein
MRSSSAVGVDLRWKDITIAIETMVMSGFVSMVVLKRQTRIGECESYEELPGGKCVHCTHKGRLYVHIERRK